VKTYTIYCNGKVVAAKVRAADRFFTRFIGLMGKKSIGAGEGLLIRPCQQIHSFHMRFKFDVIFLSKTSEVLHLIESFKQNRISPTIHGCYQVLELEDGTIKKNGIHVGDELVVGQIDPKK
jgi:uncharacterized membrane protein (UPF0127 family)